MTFRIFHVPTLFQMALLLSESSKNIFIEVLADDMLLE
jgi:hypothetical protein